MRYLISFALSCALVAQAAAAVTLPKIFSSNMVVQRDRPVVVWGWADKGETVTLTFNGQSKKAKASSQGEWSIALNPMKHGGPFVMQVKGKKEIIMLDNILIGDVWLCGGQSNMEWLLVNTNNATEEIANSDHPGIRLFTVEKELSYAINKDLKDGKWEVCSPASSKNFSAVAYFFGRKLNQDLNIPIGLINSSWGGTNVETWISWDVMSKKDEFKNVDINKLIAGSPEMKKKREAYDEALRNDIGMREHWYEQSSGAADWKTAEAPKEWSGTSIGDADGVVWFRKTFSLDADDAQSGGVLSLGPIDDWDETYVNGEKVGGRQMYNEDRLYQVPKGLLKAGENTVVVKITDTGGGGGFWGKPEQMYCNVGTKRIPLDGKWLYKASALTSDYGITTDGPNSFPSQLYNAMIAPFIKYPIAGAIWYQGESNTGEAFKYRTLFPDLIKDWRSKWGYEFPFLWVQLANFMAPVQTPQPSAWAELREAQSMTLSLPKTGQAVIIDIGEADDIHPRNKQDVGLRLALAALHVAYAKDNVYAGPVFSSMKTDGSKVRLTFTNVGGGLAIHDKYGYLKGFAVAGPDKKFYWAKAVIEGSEVVLSSPMVDAPVAVRYAWGDNPDDANLYNKDGLPASPFRTDTWKGVTQK